MWWPREVRERGYEAQGAMKGKAFDQTARKRSITREDISHVSWGERVHLIDLMK